MAFFFGNGGVTRVGFSFRQMQHDAIVTINGSPSFTMGTVGRLDCSGDRTGCVRVDATGLSTPITSPKIDGSIDDAWVVDRMAVTSAVRSRRPACRWPPARAPLADRTPPAVNPAGRHGGSTKSRAALDARRE